VSAGLLYVRVLVCLLLFLIFLLAFSFSQGNFSKGGSFECGFIPVRGESFPFSMPFFVVSLLFLLFDVEILLLCFYPIQFFYMFGGVLITSIIIVVIIFLFTLYE